MPPAVFVAIGMSAVAASIASAVASIVISIGLGMLQRALTKKPKMKGDGIDTKVTVRQPNAPWRVIYGKTRVGGTYAFVHCTDNNQHLHLVIMLAGHEVEEIGDIWFDDEVVPLDGAGNATGKYAGYVRVKKALGTADQVAFADLVAEAGDKWTANHRLRGRSALYVRLKHSQDKFPNGVPNISAVVKGRKVYDPRTATTAWTDNAALCAADYISNRAFGLSAAYGTEIEEDWLSAAANVSDEDVPLAGGGTEKRYTINGAFDVDQKPVDILTDLLNAMAGRAFHAGGRWRVRAGAWMAPTVTLDEHDLRGPFKVQTMLSRRDNFNAVKGQYISPDNRYQESDFPAVVSATFQAQDGGERVFKDIRLPFTNTASKAQRLAKIELLRARQPVTLTRVPFHLSAYRVQCGDTVGMTNARMGWTAKAFDIDEATLTVGGGSGDDQVPVLGVDLTLRETDASVYDWNTSEEQAVDPAPNTNLPDPFAVGEPVGLTLDSGDEVLLLLGEGSVISRIRATWTPPLDAFVAQYEIQWKKSAEPAWTSQIIGTLQTEWMIAPVEDGVSYDVRVRSINLAQVRSAWVQVDGHIVIGKLAPPPAPNSFTVARLPDGTRRFAWSLASVPADVRAGGGYRIRYFDGLIADWESMTPLHGGLLVASPWETNELPAGTYTFAIKTVDSSGNESASATFITGAQLGDPRLVGVIYNAREQDAMWPGTKTSCFRDADNVLYAVVSGGWDGLPDTWDALENTWSALGTGASPIAYETQVIDLGADLTFTPIVSVVAAGAAVITMKSGTAANGTVAGSYVAVGTLTGRRYVQFKVEVTGDDANIRSMSILIDGQARTEEFTDVNTATVSATWFQRLAAGHFRVGSRGDLAVISQARLALQSVGAGWSWAVISKAATVNGEVAAEFKIWNASLVLADAVVDVELRGPKKG
ncbi:hypothetical protein FHP25_35850 [Vineibacter terrae]|uniref:Fibronectin type-III domain-containing protein n=1 Tax=Vineibacter terrae TaxID=2586908 RepID=A0A5C8PA44_9HYPH|nr:phage tail protein [Vineibacter terrae]TXL70098.1 hypothetical protein FHP25_35850 [Vineibacter terrae]